MCSADGNEDGRQITPGPADFGDAALCRRKDVRGLRRGDDSGDPKGGEAHPAGVFVAVLSASSYTFAEAIFGNTGAQAAW